MWKKRLLKNDGVTLFELTLAMALFAVVLGATAQSLVSYYVALDMQNQKNTATQHCDAILSSMRDTRDANPSNFPGAITTKWPNSATVVGIATLSKEKVTVTYVNAAANPLEVTITSTWSDMRKHTITSKVSTLLTDH